MKSNNSLKNNWFFFTMILGIVLGIAVGFAWDGASALEPLGTLFINMMFCVVVPMVFFSISSSIANMKSAKRAGKLMGTTVVTFMCTTIIASVIMYVIVRFVPIYMGDPVFEETSATAMNAGEMIVGFFTKSDFPELWSRRSILQLIIAGIFFGFGVQMCGGPETRVAKLLDEITRALMNVIKLISYYAPIGFFGFFAALVAAHGADFVSSYARAIILYYVVAFAYMFLCFPLYARFGGGKGAVKVMFQHLFRPAAVAFGTCSSVATIPTNMEVSEDTGISKDVTDIVLPMGATMNMDGSGMSAIIKVAFLFGMFGKDFATTDALIAIIVATVSSVAMSGIPGGGGTGELVLCSLFFPEQLAVAFPIAQAIGDLVDPPATMVNAAGDYVASFVVSRFNDGKDWLQKKLQRDAAEQAAAPKE
ncbi:MAG: dicarboxylate/amino acid:cation symporter [Oscillospiraceae bacterium]|nr:dicarboxylate/amino acid:cation symporter [Oscillospiraceae bacterium]